MENYLDSDFAFAIQLQNRFDSENTSVQKDTVVQQSYSSTNATGDCKELYNVVDQSLELIDPTPEITALFREYDKIYFWGKLQVCEVKWSSRMTLCAGLCRYEGRGGLCSISLSAPLLKLRPRKDLVETLLHEMIHAYLFVTHNNKDHNAHGPEFLKHMHRINKLSGANVTVYHSFHDEVDAYRQHWWQCNGPCKNKRPYFGLVKRAMNRAPGPRDLWWNDHQKSCNGVFTKIKSPSTENIQNKRKRTDSDSANESPTKENKSNILNYFQPFSGQGHVLGTHSNSHRTGGDNLSSTWAHIGGVKSIEHQKDAARDATVQFTKRQPNTPIKIKGQSSMDNYVQKSPIKKSIEILPGSNSAVAHVKPGTSSSKTSENRLQERRISDDIVTLNEIIVKSDGPSSSNSYRVQTVCCPVCQNSVALEAINGHLDNCL